MGSDDLDFERQRRNNKTPKESIVSAAMQLGLSPLVLADSLKNGLLSKDHKIKDVWGKSFEGFPSSIYENAVDGMDVVTSYGPEFSKNNPTTAAVLGTGLDFLDPISLALASTKAPVTLAKGVMKYADGKASKYTQDFVKNLAKKKNMGDVPKIVNYIEKEKLRGKLGDPEKLITRIEGERKLKNEGTLDNPIYNSEKVSDGTLDEVGGKIDSTVRRADKKGAAPVNRGKIFTDMRRKVRRDNNDGTVSGVIPERPYIKELLNVLKPFDRKKTVVAGSPPSRPTMMSSIPEEGYEESINKLSKEVEQIKKSKSAQAIQKIEREKAEKSVSGKTENPMDEVRAKQAAQAKERKQAETSTAKDNSKTMAEKEENNRELLRLLLQRNKAFDEATPMDLIPEPKAQKGLPPIPAKEVLDIKLHNKKAVTQNKKYLEQDELIGKLPDMEEQIALLKNKSTVGLKEVDVPPAMPDEAFEVPPPIPREIDVPPAMPDEATGRGLEEVLAELADSRQARSNVGKTNLKIKGENSSATKKFSQEAKEAAPKVITSYIAKASKLEDMLELKRSIRKKLNETDWTRTENLPVNKDMSVDASRRVDDEIIKSLEDINLPEGNAAEIYRSLNDDFGTQNDFLEMVIDETLTQWKGGRRKGGAFPALGGGVAAALAAKAAGAPIRMAAIGGAVGGEAVKRGWGLSHASKAAIADRVANSPFTANTAAQMGVETVEKAGNVLGALPDKGEQVYEHSRESGQDPDAPVSISPQNMSPELQKMMKSMGRKPQALGEQPEEMAPDPINQKMDEVLSPQKPLWDPYINEEVLNTYLPRDSKRILANPSALMAKVHQVAPNQVPMVQELLDNDPDGMSEAGPKIAMMFPTIFEKDKYGMFDGKIFDPMMQQKFLKDLSDDEGMDSIEKANMSMKIQRGESIH